MKSLLFVLSTFLFLTLYTCDNPNNSSDICVEPSTSPCAGTSGYCYDIRIFDQNDIFIDNVKSTTGTFVWDATDCNDEQVDCGIYTIRLAAYLNGSFMAQQTSSTIVVDSTTPSATGQSNCTALEDTCDGEYIETMVTTWDPSTGTIIETVGCVCCE